MQILDVSILAKHVLNVFFRGLFVDVGHNDDPAFDTPDGGGVLGGSGVGGSGFAGGRFGVFEDFFVVIIVVQRGRLGSVGHFRIGHFCGQGGVVVLVFWVQRVRW